MSKAAAEHSLLLERETDQLREEVTQLRATVVDLESRQQQQLVELEMRQQQQVSELQGTVAALGAQVQALLQQVSMQQGGLG